MAAFKNQGIASNESFMDLTKKHCVPCEGGVLPFSEKDIARYLPSIPNWNAAENKKITRGFKFKDFRSAVQFVNRVAEVANAEDHHPDIHIFYNRVTLELSTHAIGGLSENDFILAAKINALPN